MLTLFGARNIVIDLTKAPSLTSAGMRSLIVINKLLTPLNDKTRHLKLVSPTSAVREVLDIAGLSTFIEVFDNLEAAVASF